MDLPEHAGRDKVEYAPGESQETVERRVRLPRRVQVAIVLGAAALLAAAFQLPGLFPWGSSESGQSAVSSPADGSFRPTPQQWASLTIAPVAMRTFRDEQRTDGKIAIDDDLSTPVFSPFTGRVTRVLAKTGDSVTQGQPLMAVEATEFVQAANDMISAAATLKTARAQLNLAEINEKRNHSLYLAQGGALKDWQQSQVDLANAQGGLRTAEIALGAARNRLRILGKSDQDIDAMQAASEPEQFSPEVMVNTPVSGIVLQRQVGVGQNIVSQTNGGSTSAFLIGNVAKVWLLANAREVDAPLIHLGDPVEVSVPAYPGRVFHARISYVGASIDPTTHRLPVRAEVDNPDGMLKPEMFASFRIITGADESSPSVPQEAVVFEGNTAHVWVARLEDKSILLRQIRVGRSSDGMLQVIDGLRGGEHVVTRGALFIDRAAAD